MKLKYKFVLFFVPVFTLALVAMSVVNIRLFEQDKIAYVFSSALDTTNTASTLLKTEIESQAPLFEILISSFDFTTQKFSETARSVLQMNSSLAYAAVEALDKNGYRKLDTLGTKPEDVTLPANSGAAATNFVFFENRSDLSGLLHTFKIKGSANEDYRLVLVYRKNPFKDLIDQPRFFDLFLVSKNQQILAKPSKLADERSEALIESHLNDLIGEGNFPTTKEFRRKKEFGGEAFLVAWSPANEDSGFVSVARKSKATGAIERMKISSAGFLLILLSIGLIAVLVLIGALTTNIEKLTAALLNFAKGDLETKSSIRSSDEIGTMSTVFNDMTQKIVTLLKSSVLQARMESELDTARQVQQKLVPEQNFDTSRFSVRGYFEPASECGGDWWYYLVQGDTCWMMIGDVTGHGVASALLTASMRAGVSALKDIPNLTLASFVEQLNRVIHETGQGKLMATFFISQTDLLTGETTYVNASHWAPLLIRASSGETDDVFDVRGGPRLGERAGTSYKSGTCRLKTGDVLFSFTDGLSEFANGEGREFGERRINKSLKKATEAQSTLDGYREQMLGDFNSFKNETPLPDDLTFAFFQFFPGPATDEVSPTREHETEIGSQEAV